VCSLAAAGKPVDARVRFTDTWVKMADGKWMCVPVSDPLAP